MLQIDSKRQQCVPRPCYKRHLVSVRTFGIMNDFVVFPMAANHQVKQGTTSNMAIDLVIVDDHLNLPQGFVWVCMAQRTQQQ